MADTSAIDGNDDISNQTPFVMNFSRALAVSFKASIAVPFAGYSVDTLASEIQSVLQTLLPTRITLAATRPDFDSLMLATMQAVEKVDAWKDQTLSATGQMLLRAIVTGIELDQFAIMRALQEAYTYTAQNDTSILLTARDQGVEIQRNIPSQTPARFTRQDVGVAYLIPAWSQFNSDALPWFNRNPISFAVDDISVDVTLAQGTVASASFVSSGIAYQRLEVGTETGQISDVDVRVLVDGLDWTKTDATIWDLDETAQVFWANTLPNGDVEIIFGNGLFGAAPPANVNIEVLWAETQGADGNEPRTNLPLSWTAQPNNIHLTIVTLTSGRSGADALPVEYYRLFSGDRRGSDGGSKERAVLRKDFRAHACTYPGVFDALIVGQAELAPARRSFTNVLGVSLLTDPVFSDEQWADFSFKFIPQFKLDNLILLRLDPTPVIVNVAGTIGCRPDADLELVRSQIMQLLVEATRPKYGMLGFGLYETDFSAILAGSLPSQFKESFNSKVEFIGLPALIEYVQMTNPTSDTLLDNTRQYVKLGTVNLNVIYANRGSYINRLN